MIALAYGLAFGAMVLSAIRVVQAHRASQHQDVLAEHLEEILERTGGSRALRYTERAPQTAYIAIARAVITASRRHGATTPAVQVRRTAREAFSAAHEAELARLAGRRWLSWAAGVLAVFALVATPTEGPAAVHFGLYTMAFSALAMLGWSWYMHAQVRDGASAHAPGLIDAVVRSVLMGDRPAGEGPGGAAERVVSLGATATITFAITDQDGDVREVTARDSIIKIGRYERAHVCIDDDRLARLHAIIEVGEDDLRLVDLGSDTGTKLNDKPIDAAGLERGDVITVGDYELEVVEVSWDPLGLPEEPLTPGLSWQRFGMQAGELRRNDLRSGKCPICGGEDIAKEAPLQRPEGPEPTLAAPGAADADREAADADREATEAGEDALDDARASEDVSDGVDADEGDESSEASHAEAEASHAESEATDAEAQAVDPTSDDDEAPDDAASTDRDDPEDDFKDVDEDDWHRDADEDTDERASAPTAFTCRSCGFSQWFAPGRPALE